jgi:hypothetical protein
LNRPKPLPPKPPPVEVVYARPPASSSWRKYPPSSRSLVRSLIAGPQPIGKSAVVGSCGLLAEFLNTTSTKRVLRRSGPFDLFVFLHPKTNTSRFWLDRAYARRPCRRWSVVTLRFLVPRSDDSRCSACQRS